MTIAQRYRVELQDVRERFLLMAGRVERMIAGSVRALAESDPELAREVMAQDHQVNRDELEIDDLCMSILARRNPVASELRFLTLALKMSTELERIGDLAVDVCQRAIQIAGMERARMHDALPEMSNVVQTMVRDVIDAFVDHDADSARDVIERDDLVDEFHIAMGPLLLGGPETAIGDIGVASITDSVALTITQVDQLGDDLWVVAVPRRGG